MNLPATAQQLAEKGIRESHDHAEAYDAQWTERAVRKVAAYARMHETFLAEAVKAWAYEDGLAVPPADGAWGQVMRSAANEGIVHRFGKAAATSPGSHGKLMTVWKRGPGSIEGPPLTQREVADKIRIVEETVGLLRQQGRSILAEALLDCARVFKILASDL